MRAPGSWLFMSPYQSEAPRGRRRRRRSHYEQPDPFDYIIRQREELDELERYYKERADKNKDNKEKDKKPPNAYDQLRDLIVKVSVMTVVGTPLGLLYWNVFLKEFFKASGFLTGTQ